MRCALMPCISWPFVDGVVRCLVTCTSYQCRHHPWRHHYRLWGRVSGAYGPALGRRSGSFPGHHSGAVSSTIEVSNCCSNGLLVTKRSQWSEEIRLQRQRLDCKNETEVNPETFLFLNLSPYLPPPLSFPFVSSILLIPLVTFYYGLVVLRQRAPVKYQVPIWQFRGRLRHKSKVGTGRS